MRKLALLIAALMVPMCVAQVAAEMTQVFSDGFESYVAGADVTLDKQYAAGPNYAENGVGNPWFGPGNPNARVVTAENGITPHSGNQMIRGITATGTGGDFDQDWVNIGYRFNGGDPFLGNLVMDLWFYDPCGAGDTTVLDYMALGYYDTAPKDTDYPPANHSLNSGLSVCQRLSLGMYSAGDPNFYKVRVVGASDGVTGAATWFNTSVGRTVGWHHGRIVVGPALANGTNDLQYFIDDMDNPVLVHNSIMKTGYNVIESNTRFGKTSAYFDDITLSVKRTYPTSGQCADVRTTNDGDDIMLKSKRVTAVAGGGIPTDYAYVEDDTRAGAILVHMTDLASQKIGIGDRINVAGVTATANGEKYVEATTLSKNGYPRPLDAVVMNSRAANDSKSKGLFVKLVGKVKELAGDGAFILDDGCKPIKVFCGSTITVPAVNSNVKVRGIISSDGTNATLLVRDAFDIADASAANQILPLPGAGKYFRDCLIAGPFTDPNATTATDDQSIANALMAIDFISRANPDSQIFEYNVQPAIGNPVGPGSDIKWQRYNGASDLISFNDFFNNGTVNKYSVAYAVVYVYSPVDQYVDLTLGSDDELRIWANGDTNYVFDDARLQGVGYSKSGNINYGIGVPLVTGSNTLVFKVVNGDGAFGFCANIIESGTYDPNTAGWGDGLPKADVGYYADKP